MDSPAAPKVPRPRRRGAENSDTRTLLLDAAEKLILEQGYAAVTTRRLASCAGVKSQLVHYYFATIDDVFVATIRRRGTRSLERMADMITPEEPFEGVLRAVQDREALIFWLELLALGNHRPAIRQEVRHYTEQKRMLQSAALERSFQLSGVRSEFSSAAWTLLVGGASHILSMEASLGLTSAHEETLELVHHILRTGGMVLKATDVAGPQKTRPAARARLSGVKGTGTRRGIATKKAR